MLAQSLDRRVMLREMSDGAYSPGALLAALTTLQVRASLSARHQHAISV